MYSGSASPASGEKLIPVDRSVAAPKSISFTSRLLVISRLSGLMSRCTIPSLCSPFSAVRILRISACTTLAPPPPSESGERTMSSTHSGNSPRSPASAAASVASLSKSHTSHRSPFEKPPSKLSPMKVPVYLAMLLPVSPPRRSLEFMYCSTWPTSAEPDAREPDARKSERSSRPSLRIRFSTTRRFFCPGSSSCPTRTTSSGPARRTPLYTCPKFPPPSFSSSAYLSCRRPGRSAASSGPRT